MKSSAGVALGLALSWPAAVWAVEGDPSAAGAYCPLPKAGETPECLAPAQARYQDFFRALDAGEAPEADALEAELGAETAGTEAYLALSSLTYGYLRLAQRAAENPGADPTLVDRLEQWNAVLVSTYARKREDPRFHGAVREAAADLHERTPAVDGDCGSDAVADGDCRPTSPLLDAIASIDDQSVRHGVRGALARLVERLLAEDEE